MPFYQEFTPQIKQETYLKAQKKNNTGQNKKGASGDPVQDPQVVTPVSKQTLLCFLQLDPGHLARFVYNRHIDHIV